MNFAALLLDGRPLVALIAAASFLVLGLLAAGGAYWSDRGDRGRSPTTATTARRRPVLVAVGPKGKLVNPTIEGNVVIGGDLLRVDGAIEGGSIARNRVSQIRSRR